MTARLPLSSSEQTYPARTGASRAREGAAIVVIEGQEVIREGLGELLRALDGVGEVTLVASPEEAFDAVQVQGTSPEILFVSGETELVSGPALLNRIRGHALVVVLLRSVERTALARGSRFRGDVYLLLANATRGTLQQLLAFESPQDVVLPREAAEYLFAHVNGSMQPRAPQLSRREREVLALVVEGHGNKQIARAMGISIHGVKRHVSNILRKMDCTSRTVAVARALQSGLVGSDEVIADLTIVLP